MPQLHIIVANEPRAYRDVIAATFRELRTDAAVLAVEPGELDAAVRKTRFALVVCSRLSPIVERESLAWVVLYADGTPFSEVSVSGERSIVLDMDFDRLLAVVEQAALLVA